ncbi:hypothetical protein niasHT_030329 [Heterodera trifolii]|uniref:Uncharacterized protein n=1 Tax=Heterodera trifolii TaxID=157864 RepID=A0ABD2KRH2_9BILA
MHLTQKPITVSYMRTMPSADASYAEAHYGIIHAYNAYGRCIVRCIVRRIPLRYHTYVRCLRQMNLTQNPITVSYMRMMPTADASYAESHYGIIHAYNAYGRCIVRRNPRAQNGANHWTFANLVIDFPERWGYWAVAKCWGGVGQLPSGPLPINKSILLTVRKAHYGIKHAHDAFGRCILRRSHYGFIHAYDAFGRCILRRSPLRYHTCTMPTADVSYAESHYDASYAESHYGIIHVYDAFGRCIVRRTHATQWYRITMRTPPYYHAYAIPIDAHATQMVRCVCHLNECGQGRTALFDGPPSAERKPSTTPSKGSCGPPHSGGRPPAERARSSNYGPPPSKQKRTLSARSCGLPPAERAGSSTDGPPPSKQKRTPSARSCGLPPAERAGSSTDGPPPSKQKRTLSARSCGLPPAERAGSSTDGPPPSKQKRTLSARSCGLPPAERAGSSTDGPPPSKQKRTLSARSCGLPPAELFALNSRAPRDRDLDHRDLVSRSRWSRSWPPPGPSSP